MFEQASPTYKMRFMYMSGHTDEDAFDDFARTLTWEGHAEQLPMPYLALAGDHDELSPLECTEALLSARGGPKQLVVYQDSRHSIGGVPAGEPGPVRADAGRGLARRPAARGAADQRALVRRPRRQGDEDATLTPQLSAIGALRRAPSHRGAM